MLVADGRRIVVYSSELEIVATFEAPGEVTSLDASDSLLLALCNDGGRAYFRSTGGEWVAVQADLWGDESDVCCVNDGHVWFVAREKIPAVYALDVKTRRIVYRAQLDESWAGGSFGLWSGPPGVVAVDAPMDAKYGVAFRSEQRFAPLTSMGVVLGFRGTEIALGGDALVLQSISGSVVQRIDGVTPYGIAVFGGVSIIVSHGALFALEGGKLEPITLSPSRRDGAGFVGAVVSVSHDTCGLVFRDGTLATFALE